MTIINRRRDIVDAGGLPVTDNLFFGGDISDVRNTLTTSPDRITEAFDISGNGRHATGSEDYEATGMNGQPCILNTSTRLLIDDGTPMPSTSKLSVFWVSRGTITQVCCSGAADTSIVNSTWTANTNSPLIINSAGATVAQDNTTGDAFDDYSDEVARSFAFVYDDTTNIREFYVNGVLKANSSQWTLGTASGSFAVAKWGRTTNINTLRNAVLLLYDDKLLTSTEVADLHSFVKDELGYVA